MLQTGAGAFDGRRMWYRKLEIVKNEVGRQALHGFTQLHAGRKIERNEEAVK